jgi:hypothetical protein
VVLNMGIWQEVAIGVPKVSLGPAMLDPSLWVGHPLNGLAAISGVARRPAAVFYPFGLRAPMVL